MRVVEWCGGIGAFTTSTKRLGEKVKVVDCVELDKHAVKSYNLLNDTNFEPKDINNVNVNGYGEVDLLIAGWPCQDISIAGKQKGLIESDRSSLIGTIIDKIDEMEIKPKVILLENVKGLLQEKHKEGFEVIKKTFRELGYIGSHKLLNSKFFGVPQNRERVYCVLTRDTRFNGDGTEVYNEVEVKLKDILDKGLEGETTSDYLEYSNFCNTGRNKKGELINYNFNRYGKGDRTSGTLNTFCGTGVCYKEQDILHYRKLTARECGRLMGFNDKEFNKVKGYISDSQLSKQAGNSIVVNVLVEIFRELYYGKYF